LSERAEVCKAYRIVLTDLEKSVEEVKRGFGVEIAKVVVDALDVVVSRAYNLGCVPSDWVERIRAMKFREYG